MVCHHVVYAAEVVVDTFAEQRMRDVTTMAMEMDEDAEEDLRDLDRMFLQIDANNDGTLTFDELLEGAMKVREFQNRLRVMDIDQNDLQQLFLMLDHDGGGTIDPDEFKKTLSRWDSWMHWQHLALVWWIKMMQSY